VTRDSGCQEWPRGSQTKVAIKLRGGLCFCLARGGTDTQHEELLRKKKNTPRNTEGKTEIIFSTELTVKERKPFICRRSSGGSCCLSDPEVLGELVSVMLGLGAQQTFRLRDETLGSCEAGSMRTLCKWGRLQSAWPSLKLDQNRRQQHRRQQGNR
jgi:hypothetical protein